VERQELSFVEKIVRTGRTDPSSVGPPRPPGPGRTDGAGRAIETRVFQLDVAALRREGYIGGRRRHHAVEMELGEVRRRLMREVDLFNDREQRSRACRVLITSAHPGEGKTFTAINLALSTLFQEGAPALLFDADVIRCELGKRFRFPLERNDRPILYTAESVPLGVVPSFVSREQVKSPDGRRAVIEVMDTLARRHRDSLVVVDSPPLHVMSDAAFLAAHVDHIILVVGAGMTSSDDITRSIDILGADDRVSLLLNRVRFNTDRANSYAYGYDYHAYR